MKKLIILFLLLPISAHAATYYACQGGDASAPTDGTCANALDDADLSDSDFYDSTLLDITAGDTIELINTGDGAASGGAFTISNPPTSGIYGKFKLILTNGGTVSDPWHASVKFAGGTTPTLTSSGIDILTFETIDAGSNWYAVVDGLDMK